MNETTTTIVTLPTPIKQCAADEHCRYAINGALIYSNGDTATAIATNGHHMVILTNLPSDGNEAVAIVPREILQTRKMGSRVKISNDSDQSSTENARGAWTSADNVGIGGNYPPCADVIPNADDYTATITLNAEYITSIAKAIADNDGCRAITFYLHNDDPSNKPIIVTGTRRDALGIIMPAKLNNEHSLKTRIESATSAATKAVEYHNAKK